jgi:hypothetical protein
MKTIILAVCLAIFSSACNYSHVGGPNTTFNRGTPPLGTATNDTPGAPLVLRISRHLDTVMRGPDSEEDQFLVLTVRDFRPGQKLKIPSEKVTCEFTATRFGPSSHGDTFVGYLIVRKVTATKVDASLHLDVKARTNSGSYTQTAKFHGTYSFVYRAADNDPVR